MGINRKERIAKDSKNLEILFIFSPPFFNDNKFYFTPLILAYILK